MSFFYRKWAYDLNANLLVRPALWLFGCVVLSLLVPTLERQWLRASPFASPLLEALFLEPGTAQTVLSTLAGSMMSVVSVVYSILLVALSLASVQFSTRILAGFVRDRFSQQVLGIFVGTFAYCLGVLRSIRSDPPDVPALSVALALLLALLSLASMVLFIHHIVMGIQANVIVDRIASETEGVIRTVCPEKPLSVHPPVHGKRTLFAPVSGYIQLYDVEGILEVAEGKVVEVLRPNGAFVGEGSPLFRVDTPPEKDRLLLGTVDIGAMRTMQDDVEFGFRQIVDIGLKAISPAVNDPSTGATCIDHLGRLLIAVARREPPLTIFGTQKNLLIPNTNFSDLLDLSVEQLRQYGKGDMAISLRLMRMLGEVAPHLRNATDQKRLQQHAHQVLSCVSHFSEADCEELRRRYQIVVNEGEVP